MLEDIGKPRNVSGTMLATTKIHGCFSKNTPVMLANGEQIPISELKVGNSIVSYDIEKDELIFEDRKIKCTDDHKFYTKNRGWVEAKNLTEKDEFILI